MPVSPQDFDLYSRVTGTPMPSDAMSRMRMAPDVYKFTKDFARKPNLLEKTGNLIKSAGRNTLVGAGLLAGMDLENQERQSQELLRNEIAKDDAVEATISNPMEEEKETPLTLQIEQEKTRRAKLSGEDKIKLEQMKIDAANTSQVASDLIEKTKEKVQEPTTADIYDQDVTENQTEEGYLNKKMEQGSEIATEGDTVAKVLSEGQDSKPMFRPTQIPTVGSLHAATPVVGSGYSESGNEVNVIDGVEEEMVGSSITSKKVNQFLDKFGGISEESKLNPVLLAAIQDRDKKEQLVVGNNPPFDDHPDISGGEDDSSLPGSQNMTVQGMSTSPTTDLSAHHKEMRKMEAMERNKEAIDEIVEKAPTPSERQVGKSPNELAGKDQATFLALTGNPSQQRKVEADQARSRVDQKTAAKQRMAGMQTPLTDQYYPSDVARTDIQVGGMVDRKTGLGKSVGISYTPMNGDTKVGFNIMNDPTKPTEVGTFDFVAPPETMQSLQSQGEEDLGSKTFGKLFNMARQKKQGFSGMEM